MAWTHTGPGAVGSSAGRGLWRLRGWPGLGEGGQFAGDVAGLGRPDPLKDLQRASQRFLSLGGLARGQGTPPKAGQRVRLVPVAGDGAGQVQGLLVASLCLREFTCGPVQCPPLIERHGLATWVAGATVDAQGLVQGLGCGRVVTHRPPCLPEEDESAGLAEPVADAAVDVQGLLQSLGCGPVFTRPQPYGP
jgi:hypothetical protein